MEGLANKFTQIGSRVEKCTDMIKLEKEKETKLQGEVAEMLEKTAGLKAKEAEITSLLSARDESLNGKITTLNEEKDATEMLKTEEKEGHRNFWKIGMETLRAGTLFRSEASKKIKLLQETHLKYRNDEHVFHNERSANEIRINELQQNLKSLLAEIEKHHGFLAVNLEDNLVSQISLSDASILLKIGK